MPLAEVAPVPGPFTGLQGGEAMANCHPTLRVSCPDCGTSGGIQCVAGIPCAGRTQLAYHSGLL